MTQTSTPELWDQIWSGSTREDSDQDFWQWVNRETASVRGLKIQNYLTAHLGRMDNLKTIEVGSGPGIYSFIFARMGAQVALLDYSREALGLAKQRFEENHLPADFFSENALALNRVLTGQYDVAMSFGTVEHYRNPERFQILKAHAQLARKGGTVIISVPNRFFFPHEFLKMYLQWRNKWHLGHEGAFGRSELLNTAKALNLKNVKVIGSSFLSDLARYRQIYRSTNLVEKWLGPAPLPKPLPEHLSWWDDFFGADLVLMGMKDE